MSYVQKWLGLGLCLAALLLPFAFAGNLVGVAAKGRSDAEPPVTIADGVAMTHLAGAEYFAGESSKDRVALFSPDKEHFVILLRKGVIESNTNEFVMLLFRTASVLREPGYSVLAKMASSSNRDAIRNVKWSADSRTIAFIGENPSEPAQVYEVNIETRLVRRITRHPTSIMDFDLSADGETVLFAAEPGLRGNGAREMSSPEGEVRIAGQGLYDLMAGKYEFNLGSELFWQHGDSAPLQIPLAYQYSYPHDLVILANGAFAAVIAEVRRVPVTWDDYAPVRDLERNAGAGERTRLSECLLFDPRSMSLTPLVDAPAVANTLRPAADGRSVFMRTYLPLDGTDAAERTRRTGMPYDVQVLLPGREVQKVSPQEWPKGNAAANALQVVLEEDVNTPPRIFAVEANTQEKVLLLDLNPQLKQMNLGKVRTIEWKVNGVAVTGGLYLPPDYQPGKRYPLVIQTHGFDSQRFSIDGLLDWHSAFAARPLAAHGMVVLQAYHLNEQDHKRVGTDRTLGGTPKQAFRTFSKLAYESAIDYLDGQGIVDRNRVGIVGFSRTVCFVGYTLTHSKYAFAAASLVDGIDCGYFQYVAYGEGLLASDADSINGGMAPFGAGLQKWLTEAPSFALDNVKTPVRLFALNRTGVIEQWEWYSALHLQKKPVDYTFLDDDESGGENHLLMKPSECILAQQGLLDWFRFWLKGEQNPDPNKSSQYLRWGDLKKSLVDASKVRKN